MAIPSNIFDSLRLSMIPGFQNMTPEAAAGFANSVRSFLASEGVRTKMMELGGPEMFARVQGLIDVPLTPDAVTDARARARLANDRGLGVRLGEGAARAMDFLGMAEPLVRGADVVADPQGFNPSAWIIRTLLGTSDSGDVPDTGRALPVLSEEATRVPLLGDVDLASLPVQLAGTIAPAVLAVGLAGPAVAATGLAASSPVLASTATYALGGGIFETGRQGMQRVMEDVPFDPAQIGIESLVFGASGIPFAGGPILGRLQAGAAAGGTALAVPPLVGRELDPQRAVTEAIFGLLFGNPRGSLDVRGSETVTVESKRRANIRAAGQAAEDRVLARGTSPWALELAKQAADPAVTPKLKADLASRAKIAQSLIDVLKARQSQLEVTALPKVELTQKGKLAIFDPRPLRQIVQEDKVTYAQAKAIKEGTSPFTSAVPGEPTFIDLSTQLRASLNRPDLTEVEKVMLRDALMITEGTIPLEIDAPVVTPERIAPKKLDLTETTPTPTPAPPRLEPKKFGVEMMPETGRILSSLAQYQADARIFRNPKNDPQFVSETVVFKGLTRGVDKLRSAQAKSLMDQMSPEKRMELALTIEDVREAIKIERIKAKLNALDEAALDKEVGKRIGLSVKEKAVAEGQPTSWDIEFTPSRKFPTQKEILRQMVIDDLQLDFDRLKQKLEAAQAAGATEEALIETKAALANTEERLRSGQVEPRDATEAQRVAKDMAVDKAPAEIDTLMDNLPAELRPFAKEVKESLTEFKTEIPDLVKFDKETEALFNHMADKGLITFDLGNGYIVSRYTNKAGEKFTVTESSGSVTRTSPEITRSQMKTRLLKLMQDGIRADIKLVPEEGRISVHTNGESLPVGTMADAEKFLKKVGDAIEKPGPGKVKDKATLVQVAKRKNVVVQHLGDGKYQTIDMVSGEAKSHPTLEKASLEVMAKATPNAVEITPVDNVRVTGDAPTGGPGSDGRIVLETDFDIPKGKPAEFPGLFHQTFGTSSELMQRMQDATGVPIYGEGWVPVMEAVNRRDLFQQPHLNSLSKIFRKIKANRRRVVTDLMISHPNRRRMVADQLGAKPAEVEAAQAMRKWYKDLLNLTDRQVDEFMYEVIPNFRQSGGDPTRLSADWTVPGVLREIIHEIQDGHVKMEEPNGFVLAHDILHAVGRERFVKPAIAKSNQVQEHLRSQITGKGVDFQLKAQSTTMLDLLNNFNDAAIYGGMSGRRGHTAARMWKEFFNAISDIEVHGEPLPGKKHLKSLANKVDAQFIERIADEGVGFVSGAALSVRPAISFRNMFQRFLAADIVGYDVLIDGWKKFHTPEGKQLVKESGVLGQQVLWQVDEMAQSFGKDPGIRELILKAQSAGLIPYRSVELANRAVTYLMGMESIARHADLLKSRKVEEFLTRTGLSLESSSVQRRVLTPLKDVPVGSWDNAVKKAGDEWGKRLTERTQFVYHRANAPKWMQTIPGRIFGQFGLWNFAYAELMARSLGVFGGGGGLRTKALGRMMARRSAAIVGLSVAGMVLGVDTSSYNRSNPLSMQIGPLGQLISDVAALTQNTEDEFGNRVARRNIQRFVATFGFPFGGFIQDINQSFEADDPLEALLTILGFTTKERGLRTQ